jgi:hypothetical protein
MTERLAFIRQFIDDRWYVGISIVSATDDILVVVPRDIIALYPHRKAKK